MKYVDNLIMKECNNKIDYSHRYKQELKILKKYKLVFFLLLIKYFCDLIII